MRLPKHVLVCLVAACEPAHPMSEAAPIAVEDDLTRAASEEPVRMLPMAAPRFAQPQPQQPQPPPPRVKKPKPKMIQASECGHPILVPADQEYVTALCGRG